LLSAAGVTTTWRICDRRGPTSPPDPLNPDVVALLSARRLAADSDNCGFAVRGDGRAGSALVSVPCVQEFTAELARRSASRSHPLLSSGRYDDFLGVLVAHEIGHVLGLGHASTGVMQARLDVDDIVAFRSGRLKFTSDDAARLRGRDQWLARRSYRKSP
jgi:hypothetical protein